MTTRSSVCTAVLAAALCLVGARYTGATETPAPRPLQERDAPAAGPAMSAEQREISRRKIEAVMIARMTEALKLDEAAAARFIPAISAVGSRRRELMESQRADMRDLRQELRAPAPDARRLKNIMAKLEKGHADMTALHDKELKIARQHLTPEQQARYIVFQQDFMREVRQLAAGARGGGPARREHAPGRGPGRMGPGGTPPDHPLPPN